MKKLLLSLLLLLPFAAAKADIINFSFSGNTTLYDYSSNPLGTKTMSVSGSYSYNAATDSLTSFVLNISNSYLSNGTYGLGNIIDLGGGTVIVPVGDSNSFELDYYATKTSIGGLIDGSSGYEFYAFDSLSGTPPAIAPVPEPSSWVLGLGGLMGMTVLASRKKKTTTLKTPALLA